MFNGLTYRKSVERLGSIEFDSVPFDWLHREQSNHSADAVW